MTKVPPPRLDLLKMGRYGFGSVQFSRGCPFQCEFCDIIVVFGRRPRLKTADQILAELAQMRDLKVPMVFVVDDNLIGNKKGIKPILKRVIEWQKANRFPFSFLTEASVDLADDPELLRLMADANFCGVFVGVESTNEESLRETRKLQNVRRGGTLPEKVRRIQDAGMEVFAGMIIGFDNDDRSVFAAHREFAGAARAPITMVSMLAAIPKTPLHARMAAEGRLDTNDYSEYGTNVTPLNMSRQELSEGYARLMAELYEPKAFFDRIDDWYIDGNAQLDRGWHALAAERPWLRRFRHARYWIEAFGLWALVLLRIRGKALRREYVRRFWRAFRARRSPVVSRAYALKCAVHYHLWHFSEALQETRRQQLLNTF